MIRKNHKMTPFQEVAKMTDGNASPEIRDQKLCSWFPFFAVFCWKMWEAVTDHRLVVPNKPFDLSKNFPQRDACTHVTLTSVFWVLTLSQSILWYLSIHVMQLIVIMVQIFLLFIVCLSTINNVFAFYNTFCLCPLLYLWCNNIFVFTCLPALLENNFWCLVIQVVFIILCCTVYMLHW